MLGLAVRLLPVWQWIKRLVASYPWQIALVIALAWGAYERNHHLDWRAYAKRLERDGKANVTALKAAKAKVEAKHATITGETNNETPRNRAAALAAGDAYARAHRVRWPSAAAPASHPAGGLPDAAPAAESVKAPGEAIAVGREAFDACTLNTSDLNDAYEWARKTWAVPVGQ